MCQMKFMLFAAAALLVLDSATAIVGGLGATRGQFPYYAYLKIHKAKSIWSLKFSHKYHDCGGALISNRWVVTSAQCLRNTLGAEVHLGMVKLNDTKNNGHEIFNVTKKDFHIFPTYKKENPFTNDIALIKLPTTVWFSNSLYIIPMATSPTPTATDVIAMGCGSKAATDKLHATSLQYMKLKTVDLQNCIKNTQNLISKNSLICANGTQSSICKGDLGDPLVSAGKLIGIASYGHKDCKLGLSNGFTGISSYIQWIEGVIEGAI